MNDDEISQRVSDALARPITDDFSAPLHTTAGRVLCDCCGSTWHGFPRPNGCPGGWASDDAKQKHRDDLAQRIEDTDAALGWPWQAFLGEGHGSDE